MINIIKSYSKIKEQSVNFYFYSLAIVVFTLPFAKNNNSKMILVAALFWLLSSSFKTKIKQVKNNKFLLLFVAYYLVHLISFALSDNTKVALFILEKKSGILAIPLILLSGPTLNKKSINKLLLLFATATTGGLLICLINGAKEWLISGSSDLLFYHGLSETIGMNAVYLSFYSIFSITIFSRFLYTNHIGKYTWVVQISIVLLFCGIILLASKTALITFVAITTGGILYIFNKKQKIKQGILAIVVSLLLFSTILYVIPPVKARFQKIVDSDMQVLNPKQFTYNSEFNGLTLRLLFWRISWEQYINEGNLLLGVGIGDGQDLMNKSYKDYGIYTGNPDLNDTGYLEYNSHNQYIQTLLETGTLGLFLLLAMYLYPIKYILNPKNTLLAVVFTLMLSVSITESLLETQKGSVFFALFIPLMILHAKETD